MVYRDCNFCAGRSDHETVENIKVELNRIYFDDVSKRLRFVSSRPVSKRLCIEMTKLQNYRHSTNTFGHTFYCLDSYCESFYFITRKTYKTPMSSFPRKNDFVKSALPPLQKRAAQDILQLLRRSEPAPWSHRIRLFQATAVY